MLRLLSGFADANIDFEELRDLLKPTMACAIAAQKLGIPVAHLEGGIRSGDWSMPEEINRMVTDSITNWFFTTSEFANANLRRAGVGEERIFFVGNTMIDTLLAHLDRLQPPAFWAALGLRAGEQPLSLG